MNSNHFSISIHHIGTVKLNFQLSFSSGTVNLFLSKGAIGTFIDGRPFVCGGRSSVEDYFDLCHSYNVANDSWTEEEPMKERRFQV